MFSFNNVFKKKSKVTNIISPIGLEISLTKLHLVQLEKDSQGEIHYRAKVSLAHESDRRELLTSPKKVKKLIRQAFKSANFSGRKVVTAMPVNNLNLISVSYQVQNGQSEDEAIVDLMMQRVDGDLSDYVIDYLPVRDASNKDKMSIIAYAKRDHVINYLELLRKAGLHVEKMEIGPSAIKRLICTTAKNKDDENLLVINFGRSNSYISLISGDKLLFDQEIEFGEDILIAHISIRLNVSLNEARHIVKKHGLQLNADADSIGASKLHVDIPKSLNQILKPMFMKLAEEINHALIFATSETHGKPVKHVYLLGSIARWYGVDKLLSALINIPVSYPEPLKEKNEDINHSEIAIASGLALNGLGR